MLSDDSLKTFFIPYNVFQSIKLVKKIVPHLYTKKDKIKFKFKMIRFSLVGVHELKLRIQRKPETS